MPIKKSLQALAIISFGIFFSLLLIEAGIRLFQSFGNKKVVIDRPSFYYKQNQAELFRDYPESFSQDAQPKIAVIGDSFSFATQMQFDDAFPNKLENLLKATGNSNAEVLNYGVPGFSTSHETDSVVEAVEAGAEIVLLQVTLNDPQIKTYRPSGLTGHNTFGPLTLSPLEMSISRWWRTYKFIRERIHNTQTHSRYVEYYHNLFYQKRTWNSFKLAVTRIVNYCRRKKVKLGIVVFPLFGVPLDSDYPFLKIHQRVANLAKRKNTSVLDLWPVYQGLELEQIQVIPGVDFHPNEIGHSLAAEAIWEWLVIDSKFLTVKTKHDEPLTSGP